MNQPMETAVQVAIQACIAHAKQELYRDIGDVAALMGVNQWVLYKWVQAGKLPAVHIPAFECACGANHLSKCLAAACGLLTIKAPPAAGYTQVDWTLAQWEVAKAMADAAGAAVDPGKTKQALKAVNAAMDALASTRHQLALRSGHEAN